MNTMDFQFIKKNKPNLWPLENERLDNLKSSVKIVEITMIKNQEGRYVQHKTGNEMYISINRIYRNNIGGLSPNYSMVIFKIM